MRERKPISEIEDDAGKESGFGGPQEKAYEVEAAGAAHQGHAAGENSPGGHDDGDPAARPEAQQDEVAGNFEECVAKEEEAGTGAVDGVGESQVAADGERCEAEIDAVEIGENVKREEKWDEPPENPAQNAVGLDDGSVDGRFPVRLGHAFSGSP